MIEATIHNLDKPAIKLPCLMRDRDKSNDKIVLVASRCGNVVDCMTVYPLEDLGFFGAWRKLNIFDLEKFDGEVRLKNKD